MADGYALIEINTEGKARAKDVTYFDFRLIGCDIEHDDIADQVSYQLPEGIKDVLVLVVFNLNFITSYDWESGYHECDEIIINLESHNIVKTDYKEFYRELVTEEIKYYKDVSDTDKENYNFLLLDWEEFYDEDFKPSKTKPKQISGIGDLIDFK